MSNDRITTADLTAMLARYVRALDALGIAPDDGWRIGLDHGSKLYGRAFRLYVTGAPRPFPGGIDYPNGTGHHNPPAGSDFLGMTKREAFDTLADRCRTLEDVAHLQERRTR